MNRQTEAMEMVRNRTSSTISKGQYPNGIAFEVHVVWAGYILGNEKYLLTTDLPDGKYYEVTYNVYTNEMYLDEYVRVHNEVCYNV